MPKLSVIVITFNEEKKLGKCLESVQEIADEIIIVDSYSTDSTEAVARQFNAKFIQRKWTNYSDQKNYANSLASNNLIFSIDADEAVSEKLKKTIIDLKKQEIADNETFTMNRITNYCGKWIRHCGWYPDTKTRIWNRNIGQWKGAVHEVLEFNKPTKTVHLKGDLLHYSFENRAEFEKQRENFVKALSQQYLQQKKKNALLRSIISPAIHFVKHYIFQLGFLDGRAGWQICCSSTKLARQKYMKLNELKKRKKYNKSTKV